MRKRNLVFVIAVVTAITIGFMFGRISLPEEVEQTHQSKEETQLHYMNWFLIGFEFEQYTLYQEDLEEWNKVMDEALALIKKENVSTEEELEFLNKLTEFNLEMNKSSKPSLNEM